MRQEAPRALPASNNRKILVVDDDADAVEIVRETLQWEGYQVSVAASGEDALKKLGEWGPHLVLLDIGMPGLSGLDILDNLRKSRSYISVLFVSGHSRTEDVVRGLDAGADDYITKPYDPRELLARVRTQLRIKDLNDQLRSANEKLKELVEIDDLTGLFNMRSVYQRLEHELDRGRRFGRPVCAVMMDMDNFKMVNDAHDHLFGSFALSEVGYIVKTTIRSVDIAARYGGDEFLIVLTEVHRDGAMQFCERLRKAIEKHVFDNGHDRMALTASIGFAITQAGDSAIDARSLVRVADRALYDAKEAGRNCVRDYDLAKTPEVLNFSQALKRKAGPKLKKTGT
ncbi:MAG: diguanylate cyclase [Pseudobdellovibrionaceae bacterium]